MSAHERDSRAPFPDPFLCIVGHLGAVRGGCGSGADPVDTTVPPAEEISTTTAPQATTPPTTAPSITTTAPTTTAPPTETELVTLYFATGDGADCSQVGPFEREVPVSDDPITAAFDLLVGGPTADEATAGAGSFFSAATARIGSLGDPRRRIARSRLRRFSC